ncbi:MAG TPA: hypothetical protein DCG47_02470 [Spirochaetaceae bacterium]|nr:hypothetical protein [Spirochaetaceae bacterium]
MKTKRRATSALLIALLLLSVLLVSCLPGDGKLTAEKPGGFWSGIWHGWMAPLSLIVSIFKPEIRIYELNNGGWWYDFGFYLAIVGGFGGIALSRKRKPRSEA